MKTVIVTGGSRGIGKAIVEKFASNGYNVILNYNIDSEIIGGLVFNINDTIVDNSIKYKIDNLQKEIIKA